MWQVLVAAAAAAGSAILAKKLSTEKSFSGFSPNDQEHAQDITSQSQDSIFHSTDALEESTIRVKSEPLGNEGEIFRFSSVDSRFRKFKKSNASGLERVKKNIISKKGKRIGSSTNGGGKGKGADQRAYAGGKRVSVCLKKRRTSKFVAGNCESCASKDNSFNWGVGIGIMYMMSAGKAEINRLNFAVDETSKLVQEIKSEISRSKLSSSCEPHISVAEDDSETNEIGCKKSYTPQGCANIDAKGGNKLKRFQHPSNQDGECAGSVLTEDQRQPDLLEIDHLQAELEFELQKLPWCATESSGSEGRNDIFKAEDSAEDHQRGYSENSSLYPVNGVSPVELNQKLSCLLIEQQENQIVELESELQQAHRQLHEKEAELKALRDCVKSLTQLSLADASDEETEDTHKRSSVQEELGFDSTESMASLKSSLDCESNACFTI